MCHHVSAAGPWLRSAHIAHCALLPPCCLLLLWRATDPRTASDPVAVARPRPGAPVPGRREYSVYSRSSILIAQLLACWRAGVLACWRAGVLACWRAGVTCRSVAVLQTRLGLRCSRFAVRAALPRPCCVRAAPIGWLCLLPALPCLRARARARARARSQPRQRKQAQQLAKPAARRPCMMSRPARSG